MRAFLEVEGLDGFSSSLLPLLKSCWQLNKSVEFTAERVDLLCDMTKMSAMLYEAEVKQDRKA